MQKILRVAAVLVMGLLSVGSWAYAPKSKMPRVSAPPVARIPDLSVSFDSTNYSLKHGKKTLQMRGTTGVHEIELGCGSKIVQKMSTEFWSAKNNVPFPPRIPIPGQKALGVTPYDVKLKSKGKTESLARGSSIGTWLRGLPARMPALELEAKVQCLKK